MTSNGCSPGLRRRGSIPVDTPHRRNTDTSPREAIRARDTTNAAPAVFPVTKTLSCQQLAGPSCRSQCPIRPRWHWASVHRPVVSHGDQTSKIQRPTRKKNKNINKNEDENEDDNVEDEYQGKDKDEDENENEYKNEYGDNDKNKNEDQNKYEDKSEDEDKDENENEHQNEDENEKG
ncbi:putative uncharacterized protein DDB_G0292438 [Venturia canescens]|uniref:putative uncharacterized protein DDB_G0292438 n=1 Tax=Venturia canescens TaxID=32260 RepID=UPI001C9C8394|nr:putative uncharacterized protein DDB_G0292438 [Venturia canescens]